MSEQEQVKAEEVKETQEEKVEKKKKLPRYKTKSFWVSLVATVLGAFLASDVAMGENAMGMIGVVVAVLGAYGVSVPRFDVQEVKDPNDLPELMKPKAEEQKEEQKEEKAEETSA